MKGSTIKDYNTRIELYLYLKSDKIIKMRTLKNK